MKLRIGDLGGRPLWAVRVGVSFIDGEPELRAAIAEALGPARFQDGVQPVGVRGQDEAEGHGPLSRLDRMMQPVCLDQSTGISVPGHPVEGPALVHQTVMHEGIDEPVQGDAQGDRANPPQVGQPGQDEQATSDDCADHAVKVVDLEHLVVRLVVVAVPGPAKGAVHHIAMRGPGDAFHQKEDCHGQGGEPEGGHGLDSTRWTPMLPA